MLPCPWHVAESACAAAWRHPGALLQAACVPWAMLAGGLCCCRNPAAVAVEGAALLYGLHCWQRRVSSAAAAQWGRCDAFHTICRWPAVPLTAVRTCEQAKCRPAACADTPLRVHSLPMPGLGDDVLDAWPITVSNASLGRAGVREVTLSCTLSCKHSPSCQLRILCMIMLHAAGRFLVCRQASALHSPQWRTV